MNNPLLTKTFKAGGALTKYRIVKFGSDDDSVVQATAATDALMGVVAELDVSSGERGDIHLAGVAQVVYGGTITRGDLLTADSNGKAVKVTRHTHTENTAASYTQNATTGVGSGERIIGVAMVSGVSGDIGSVLIQPAYA